MKQQLSCDQKLTLEGLMTCHFAKFVNWETSWQFQFVQHFRRNPGNKTSKANQYQWASVTMRKFCDRLNNKNFHSLVLEYGTKMKLFNNGEELNDRVEVYFSLHRLKVGELTKSRENDNKSKIGGEILSRIKSSCDAESVVEKDIAFHRFVVLFFLFKCSQFQTIKVLVNTYLDAKGVRHIGHCLCPRWFSVHLAIKVKDSRKNNANIKYPSYNKLMDLSKNAECKEFSSNASLPNEWPTSEVLF
jgi:hypothetical protein